MFCKYLSPLPLRRNDFVFKVCVRISVFRRKNYLKVRYLATKILSKTSVLSFLGHPVVYLSSTGCIFDLVEVSVILQMFTRTNLMKLKGWWQLTLHTFTLLGYFAHTFKDYITQNIRGYITHKSGIFAKLNLVLASAEFSFHLDFSKPPTSSTRPKKWFWGYKVKLKLPNQNLASSVKPLLQLQLTSITSHIIF